MLTSVSFWFLISTDRTWTTEPQQYVQKLKIFHLMLSQCLNTCGQQKYQFKRVSKSNNDLISISNTSIQEVARIKIPYMYSNTCPCGHLY